MNGQQMVMFGRKRGTTGMVRRNDHMTSKLAAMGLAAGCGLNALQGRVLLWLASRPGPVTDEELVAFGAANGYAESTLRKRRTELVELGYVRASGSVVKNARGCHQIAWTVTESGRRQITGTE